MSVLSLVYADARNRVCDGIIHFSFLSVVWKRRSIIWFPSYDDGVFLLYVFQPGLCTVGLSSYLLPLDFRYSCFLESLL